MRRIAWLFNEFDKPSESPSRDLQPNSVKSERLLVSVLVAPEYRGKGVATVLEKEICRLAKSISVSTLYLQTEALDGGLYAGLGWKDLEIVEDADITVLVMEKNL